MHLSPALLPAATQAPAASSGWIFYVLIVGMVVLFWFMSRQQKKKQQAAVSFRDSLAPGQEVMTIGRLVGTITDVRGDEITIETTPGTSFRVMRTGIAQLIEPDEPEVPDLDPADKAGTINLNGKDVPRSAVEGGEGDNGPAGQKDSKG